MTVFFKLPGKKEKDREKERKEIGQDLKYQGESIVWELCYTLS